jgi:phosphodiesterase/alkaline phosphatase D-like protein
MTPSTRRELLAAAAAGGLLLAAPPAGARRLVRGRAGLGLGRFRDGVASGEPSATAITFWSRLRTDHPRSGARLIISRDDDLRRTVAVRVVPTGRAIDWTLKARVGGLDPATEYFYVWQSGNDVSDVGRARTLPHPSSRDTVRLAFSSCQHFAHGHFTPHADAAAQDLDLCVFLGDYIYAERRIPAPLDPRRDTRDANDLRSYRAKYRRYRADPALRELHRLHPMVHIWDDHEIENNYTDNRPAPAALQRAAGYRAAFEWLPRASFRKERFRLYRRIALGRTADLFLLDLRQYRAVDATDHPISLMGDKQREWLIRSLRASRARWKIIANQVPIAPMDYGSGPRMDSWGGYDASRARLLGEIERAGIDDVVFFTGDAHVFMVNGIASEPSAPPSAVEYVCGSVTSPGRDRPEADVRARNPWTRQYNGRDHGYGLATVADNQLAVEYRRSDISRPDGVTLPLELFTQPAGVNDVARQPPPV